MTFSQKCFTNNSIIAEGRRKKEEGRRKKEEGRRKKEGRRKEEGRRKKEEGKKEEGHGSAVSLLSNNDEEGGHGSAVSLLRLIVGTQHCCVLTTPINCRDTAVLCPDYSD